MQGRRLEIAEVGATAPCGAVLPRLRVALRVPRGPVAVQPTAVCERPVDGGVGLGVEISRQEGRQGPLMPRLDESRHLLGLTLPYGIGRPAGGGRARGGREGRRHAGIPDAARGRTQVTVRGQMGGEDVEGPQRMSQARIQHMTDEEGGQGAVQRQDLTGQDRIAAQDQFLVNPPAQRGRPTTRRRVNDDGIGESTRRRPYVGRRITAASRSPCAAQGPRSDPYEQGIGPAW
jgi:hypothetical protein